MKVRAVIINKNLIFFRICKPNVLSLYHLSDRKELLRVKYLILDFNISLFG